MAESLEKLGNLNPAQAEILKIVLMRSPASLAVIAAYSKKKVDQIQKIIKELEGLKLVKTVPGVLPRYVGLPPYAGYLKYLDKFSVDLSTAKKQATESVNQIPTQAASLVQANIQKLNEALQSAEKEASAAVEAAKAEISTTISAEKEKFTTDLTKVTEDLSLITKDAPEKFKKSSTATIDKHKVTFEKLKGEIVAELDKISGKLDQALKATEMKQQKTLETQQAGVLQQIEDISATVIESSDKLGKDLGENATQLSSTLDTNAQNFKDNVSEFSQESTTKIQASIDSSIASFSKFLQVFDTKAQKDFKSFNQGIQGDLKSFQDTQVTALDGSLTSFTNQVSKNNADLQGLAESLKGDFDSKVGDLISKEMEGVSSKLDQVKNQLTGITAKYVEEFIAGADHIKTTIDQTVGKQVAKTEGEIRQALDAILEKYTGEIKNQTEIYAADLKNQINGKVVDFRANIKQMREQFEEELATSAESLSQNLLDMKTQMLAQVSDFKQDLTTKFGESINAGNQQLSGVIDSAKEIVQGTVNRHQTSINTMLSENSKSLLANISDTDKSLQGLGTEQKSAIGSQIQDSINSFAQQVTENVEKSKKYISDQITSAVDSATSNKEALNTATKSFRDQVTGILAESQAGINSIYSQLEADFKKPVADIKTTSAQKLESALGDLTAMASEAGTAYSKSADDLALKAKKQTDLLKTTVDKHLSVIDQQLIDTAGTGVTAISTVASGIKGNIEQALKDWLTKTQGIAATTTQTVEQAIAAGISAADSPKQLLADTWKAITETSLIDAEKTWAIVGEQAIYPQVEEMIRNAKSAVILIAPKFDDFNWDLIKAARAKGVKFTIACVYETARNAKAPKAMVENGVDLWGYAEKDLIAAVRDQEEILLAPIAPKEDETVAIVSSATPLVKNLGTMLLDFYRRTAKKFQMI